MTELYDDKSVGEVLLMATRDAHSVYQTFKTCRDARQRYAR